MKQDKFIILPLFFSAFSIVLLLILLLVFYSHLPDRLPLFYSLSWGEAELVKKDRFFLLPTILLLLTLVNFFITSQLHSLQYILKRILMLSLVLIDLIFLVTTIKILLIFL